MVETRLAPSAAASTLSIVCASIPMVPALSRSMFTSSVGVAMLRSFETPWNPGSRANSSDSMPAQR